MSVYTPPSSVNYSFVPFYVLYLPEWFVRLICYCNSFKAYRSISFEQEAYTYGVELGYLKGVNPMLGSVF